MNTSDLTNDSYYFLVKLYKEYLSRVRDGADEDEANDFHNDVLGGFDEIFTAEPRADKYLEELQNHRYIFEDIQGNISITDKGIKLMESRFSKNLDKVLEIINLLKP